ncbi:MAG TPA: NAD(P)/FAD-dependent oxidoreductase [Roseiflexaceae bacterium]|nr:NAD(P)/FAD-dependent oxidoreductase [Roseiflexaceae bacterium]
MTLGNYETIVIGAGSGGLTVAIGLAGLGRRVALVEGRHVGGDCTNVGCIPSKTLIHLADERGGPSNPLPLVQTKRDALRDQETEHVRTTPNLELISGWARFVGPKRLEITGSDGARRELAADHIVVATGSRPRRLDIPGLPDERVLTNESVFELAEPPRHLAIIGSGVIGMELAFAFHKLGTRVTVVTTSQRVLASAIPEASEALRRALEDRGIAVYTRARAEGYDQERETLRVRAGDQNVVLEGVDRVLLAIGRERTLEGLELERAGVATGREGVRVDSFGQTSAPGIYAIGDVTPTSHYTHSANAQGRRVVQRIAFPLLPARGPEPLYPSAIFSDPEVASVGMTPEQIARRFHPELVRRLRVELRDIDRGYTDGVRHGFVIVDAVRLTGRILGATIVGPRASEMISFFTLAISAGISLFRLYRLVYPYPTYSGAIQKVADAFMRETLPHLPRELRAYLRYRLARPGKEAAGAYVMRNA